MFYHSRLPGAQGFLFDCTTLIWMMMDSFFVLSGFLIGRGLLGTRGRPDYFSNFYARRALRIMPLYYLVLGSVMAVSVMIEGGSRYAEMTASWGSPWWFVTFLANIPLAYRGVWAPVSSLMPLWSLQVEVQFYLLVPIAFRYLEGRSLRRFLWGLAVLSPLFRAVAYWAAPGNDMIQYVLLPCRMEGFAFGMLVAEKLSRPALPGFSKRHLAQMAGLAWVAAICWGALNGLERTTPGNRTLGYLFSSIASALTVWRLSLGDTGRLYRWIAAPPVLFLARISYAIYVVHIPVFNVVSRVIRRLDPRYVDTPVSILCGVLSAILVAWLAETTIGLMLSRRRRRNQNRDDARPRTEPETAPSRTRAPAPGPA